MFIIYLHTKCHLPSSNGSLIIVVKLRAKENFRTVAMLFCVLHKNTITKLHVFRASYQGGAITYRSILTSLRVRHVWIVGN
jgi:hypothetical protein